MKSSATHNNATRGTVADFFCGAGGWTEGFRQKGFDVIYALDHWKPAIQTHEFNHPDCEADLRDILELNTPEKIDEHVPDTDIIVGSPPCVSFSGSNKAGKADKTLGVQLMKAYLRIVAWKKSKGHLKYWALENVPNAGKHLKDKYTWKELGLPGEGPDLEIPVKAVINAAHHGAPQGRKRFVCGNYPQPEETHGPHNWVTISKVMGAIGNPTDSKKPQKVKDPVHGFSLDSSKLSDHFYDSRVEEYEWSKAKRLKVDHGFMGKMTFPDETDRPSRTVMATMSSSTRESMIFDATKDGEHIGYRAPTIREVASFMGFPINYQFVGNNESTKYKQVGNAVCVPMSAAIATAILKAEGLDDPGYIKLPNREPPFDLNGRERRIKAPTPRRDDAKFAIHVPHIKIGSFRVELSNKASDFKKGAVEWKSFLHYGTGKNMRFDEISQEAVEEIGKGITGFTAFSKDVKKKLIKDSLTHQSLQKNYVLNGTKKLFGPEDALNIMKELVDKHFPEEEYGQKSVTAKDISKIIGRDSVPIRILAALYACNEFVNNL